MLKIGKGRFFPENNILCLFSIEGNQLETREEHKYWLTRHLEMCRQIILRDFRIITVKNLQLKTKKKNFFLSRKLVFVVFQNNMT